MKVSLLCLCACSLALTAAGQTGTNAVRGLTDDESSALLDYQTERLYTTNAVILSEAEWEVLNTYRAEQAQEEAQTQAKQMAHDAWMKTTTVWQRFKAGFWEHPIIGTIGLIWLALVTLGWPIGFLREKWRDWRLEVWYRNYRKNQP